MITVSALRRTWPLTIAALLTAGCASPDDDAAAAPAPAATVTVTEQAAADGDEGGSGQAQADARIAQLEEENRALRETNSNLLEAGAELASEAEADLGIDEPTGGDDSFSDGIYIVGDDIAAGTYRTDGSDFCSLLQYPDLSREMTSMMGHAQGGGPMIFEATTEGSVLEVSGGCTWTQG